MGKKKHDPLIESNFEMPVHPAVAEVQSQIGKGPIVDSHCHLSSTFGAYRRAFPQSNLYTVAEFVAKYMSEKSGVSAVVDVWCEAPFGQMYKELAESNRASQADWGNVKYNFVMGLHPHEAKNYNDSVEQEIVKAMAHPACVGWGEIGLDYHYMNSDKEVQQKVLRQQLAMAVKLQKSITIHTREADEDIWTILTECLPKEQKVHIHCYTDTLELAIKLLDHFPNLVIGITGVTTFKTNLNTPAVLKHLGQTALASSSAPTTTGLHPLRLVLETDSPYMVPGNLPRAEIGLKSNQKLSFSHSAMIAWTADFISDLFNAGLEEPKWTTADIIKASKQNIEYIYNL